jgi:hypothetical protein
MPLSARIGIKKYIESGKASIREEKSKKTIIAAQQKTISIVIMSSLMTEL